MSIDSVFLTAKQVRAGRALLAWSQQELAKIAGIAPSTLADFERGQRTPVPNNAQAIKQALENAGISFPPGGAVVGPPLPALGQISKSGVPIRWVDLTDLAQWAERRDGQGSLPTLLAKLVRATGCVSVHFPSDEGVQHPGWDGISQAKTDTEYVPQGFCGWEIGTQREKIIRKANEDYDKRTDDPEHLILAESTFIFVTPRPWSKKEKWIKEKRDQGLWGDVRAYDGTDLVHWIELYPAVGRWLATYLGKRPSGTLDLEEIWQQWSLSTQWPLTVDLILSDRDKNSVSVLSWLRSAPAAFALQGDTTEEVCSFLYAAISQLPEEVAEHYFARCLIASDPEMGRRLADSITPLIIVLLDPQPGLAQAMVQKGHHVLCAYGSNATIDQVQKLERPTREGIEAALQTSGVPQDLSIRMARESSRSLAILRRLMPSQAGSIPRWAQTPPSRALLSALLAGGWDESSSADVDVMNQLAGAPYEDLVSEIVQYTGRFDSPLRKIGKIWKVASPQDAWLLLAPYLTSADIDRFESVIVNVLSSADPRYKMDPEERWLAPIREIQPEYSEVLRHGLGATLIMLALFGERVHAAPNAASLPGRVVHSVLHKADGQCWWSLSREFQLLAEAAPEHFLAEIERSLDQAEPAISSLFGTDGDGTFSVEHLSDLLWALESLAWAPCHLAKVSEILARLDAIDPGGRYSNRPGSSLRQIYLLWLPQTYANQGQRFIVLDRLRRSYPDQAWKLMKGILPGGHDTASDSATARWRDYKDAPVETVTYPLIGQGTNQLVKRLLEDVKGNVQRWQDLLGRLSDMPDPDAVIVQLSVDVAFLTNEHDQAALWNYLRKVLNHHREFPDAEWSLSGTQITALQTVYDSLQPTNSLKRIAWLFDQSVSLPNPDSDWEENQRRINERRREAAIQLFQTEGIETLFELAQSVQDAASLGGALVNGGIDETDLEALIKRGLRSEQDQHRWMAQGAIGAKVTAIPNAWLESLFKSAIAQHWSEETLLHILKPLSVNHWTWALAQGVGSEFERAYWRQAPKYRIVATEAENHFVVEKLVAVGRASDAVHFIGGQNRVGSIPSELVVKVLLAAASEPRLSGEDRNDSTMFQYYLVEILKHLDAAGSVSEGQMITIEWAYLTLLEHSKRPPKLLPKVMAESPELFVQVICAIFKPSEESGIVDPLRPDPEHAKNVAKQAHNMLRVWDVLPGTLPDGKIDAHALEAWVKEARKLAKNKGRDAIADQKIGEALSASPVGEDGIWPVLEIRELIESVRSEHLELGFAIGHRNRRGVTTRLLREGGDQERELATRYQNYSKATALGWHRTSAVLANIARSYEADARMQDDSVEKLDWR